MTAESLKRYALSAQEDRTGSGSCRLRERDRSTGRRFPRCWRGDDNNGLTAASLVDRVPAKEFSHLAYSFPLELGHPVSGRSCSNGLVLFYGTARTTACLKPSASTWYP